jgi:hypothetical protein
MKKSALHKSAFVYMAVNIETGHSYIGNDKIVYQTNKEAKEAYGIGRNTIYRACHRGDEKPTMSGLAFMFLDEWCPNPE